VGYEFADDSENGENLAPADAASHPSTPKPEPADEDCAPTDASHSPACTPKPAPAADNWDDGKLPPASLPAPRPRTQVSLRQPRSGNIMGRKAKVRRLFTRDTAKRNILTEMSPISAGGKFYLILFSHIHRQVLT